MIFNKRKISLNPLKNIAFFVQLARVAKEDNFFAMEDCINKMKTLSSYYKYLVNLILDGTDPEIIAYKIMKDFTDFHEKRKYGRLKKDLIMTENLLGYGLFYLQCGYQPQEMESQLIKLMVQINAKNRITREFKGSYYISQYLVKER